MDPSEKRVSGEGNSNGGDDSNLQVVPYSDNKKICCYCKREFKCGRGLGGHIRVHFTGRKVSKSTRKRKNNRRAIRSSAAAPPRRRDNEVSGGEITDLSMLLVGSGWRVQKKRGSNEMRNKRVLMEHDSFDDDDHVECDDEDSCDEDDYHNIRLRKKLRSDGLTNTAHKICWTKRVFMYCKVCNDYFKTYRAAFRHANECEPTSDVEEGEEEGEGPSMEIDQVVDEAAAEGREGDAEDCVDENEEREKGENAIGDNNQGFVGVGEKESNEGNDGVAQEVSEKSGGGGSMDQEMSTSVTAPKILDFDLNEMPPEED